MIEALTDTAAGDTCPIGIANQHALAERGGGRETYVRLSLSKLDIVTDALIRGGAACDHLANIAEAMSAQSESEKKCMGLVKGDAHEAVLSARDEAKAYGSDIFSKRRKTRDNR